MNAVINFQTPFKAKKNYKMNDYQLLKNELAPQGYLLQYTWHVLWNEKIVSFLFHHEMTDTDLTLLTVLEWNGLLNKPSFLLHSRNLTNLLLFSLFQHIFGKHLLHKDI